MDVWVGFKFGKIMVFKMSSSIDDAVHSAVVHKAYLLNMDCLVSCNSELDFFNPSTF